MLYVFPTPWANLSRAKTNGIETKMQVRRPRSSIPAEPREPPSIHDMVTAVLGPPRLFFSTNSPWPSIGLARVTAIFFEELGCGWQGHRGRGGLLPLWVVYDDAWKCTLLMLTYRSSDEGLLSKCREGVAYAKAAVKCCKPHSAFPVQCGASFGGSECCSSSGWRRTL